mgnify:FL=1
MPQLAPPAVTAEAARALALDWALYVTNSIGLRSVVEDQRGGYWTDTHLLHLCAPLYYARASFGAAPADAPLGTHRLFGDHWVVPLCDDAGDPEMTVEIAVVANTVTFADAPNRPRGLVSDPTDLTLAFWGNGVPWPSHEALVISAEEAVAFAATQTGAPVTAVPELVHRSDVRDGRALLSIGAVRYCSRWRLQFDQNVSFRSLETGAERLTREVYVGTYGCSPYGRFDLYTVPEFHVPRPAQPDLAAVQYASTDSTGVLVSRTGTMRVVRPVWFERVVAVLSSSPRD